MEEIFAASGQTEDIRKRLSAAAQRIRESHSRVVSSSSWKSRRVCTSLSGRSSSSPLQASSGTSTTSCLIRTGGEVPGFEHAPAMLTLDLMEKLHVCFRTLLGAGSRLSLRRRADRLLPLRPRRVEAAGGRGHGRRWSRSWSACARYPRPHERDRAVREDRAAARPRALFSLATRGTSSSPARRSCTCGTSTSRR